MKKSVYSLVLSDHVIAATDKAAAKRGMSRSAFINEVLASHLSCVTPQMQMRTIFKHMEALALRENFRIKTKPSDDMISFLSSLSYKYNPTVRFAVTLTQGTEREIGILKVIFRTQNAQLTKALEEFFYFFCQLEKSFAPSGVKYKTEPGKFSRLLVIPDGIRYSATEIANAISDYIKMFDNVLNAYFQQFPNRKVATVAAAQVYKQYLNTNTNRI